MNKTGLALSGRFACPDEVYRGLMSLGEPGVFVSDHSSLVLSLTVHTVRERESSSLLIFNRTTLCNQRTSVSEQDSCVSTDQFSKISKTSPATTYFTFTFSLWESIKSQEIGTRD